MLDVYEKYEVEAESGAVEAVLKATITTRGIDYSNFSNNTSLSLTLSLPPDRKSVV